MNFKKILSIFLALTLVFTFGTLLTSCGGDTECTEHADNDTDGKCDTCGATVETEGGVCQTPVATDANGKAVIRFIPSGEELKARVLSVPDGYAYPDDVDAEGYIHVAAGTTEITLTLVAQ